MSDKGCVWHSALLGVQQLIDSDTQQFAVCDEIGPEDATNLAYSRGSFVLYTKKGEIVNSGRYVHNMQIMAMLSMYMGCDHFGNCSKDTTRWLQGCHNPDNLGFETQPCTRRLQVVQGGYNLVAMSQGCYSHATTRVFLYKLADTFVLPCTS